MMTAPLLKIGDFVDVVEHGEAMCAVPLPKCWHMLRAQPNCERRLGQFLERRGISCYVPTYFAGQRAARRKRILVRRVMFPGYVFVPDFELMAHPAAIRMAPGALSFLHFGEHLAQLSPAAMVAIRDKESVLAVRPKDRSRLRIGQRVRFVEGPFEGILANVQKLRGHERVALLMEIAGRSWPIEVPEDEVEPVDDGRMGGCGA